MAEKKQEKKSEIEREYVIPLRKKFKIVPRYKKTNKAVKTVKEFLARHMKIRDRDLRKIKIDSYLNEFLWSRGIRNPPHKIKVKAIKEGDIVRVELVKLPKKIMVKKARQEKIEKAGEKAAEKKKVEAKKKEEEKKPAEEKKEGEEEEKKKAVVEAGKEMEKEMAKKAKHSFKGSKKSPIVHRKALAK